MKYAFFSLQIFLGLYCAFGQDQGSEAIIHKPLQPILDSIEVLMEEAHIPGLMMSMVIGDSIIYSEGLGAANLEKGISVTPHTRFRQGSITKTLGSLAIFQLVSEGKISFDDNLRDLAPEIPFKNSWEDKHPVKLVHLLEHTTGFDDMHFAAIYNEADAELPMIDMVLAHKNSLACRWQPGTRMSYSNPGYVIIGYLIEKYSGKSYHEYIQQTFFEPVGMDHANLESFPDLEDNYAQGYKLEGKQAVPVPFYPVNGGIAGTLNASGMDMGHFLTFFLNSGSILDTPLIGPEVIDQMELPTSSLAARHGLKTTYAKGNYASQFEKPFLFHGHNGGIDGFSSVMKYCRELGVGYALSNNINGSTYKIEKLIIEFLVDQVWDSTRVEPIFPDSKPFLQEGFEGYYQMKSPRNQINYFVESIFSNRKLTLDKDTLFIKKPFDIPRKYVHLGEGIFQQTKRLHPSMVLGLNEDGKRFVVVGDMYFEKIPTGIVWARVAWFICAVVAVLLFLPVGLIYLLLMLIGRIPKAALPSILGFTMGGLGVCLVLFSFSSLQSAEGLPAFGQFNTYTGLIYLGTLMLGVGSLLGTLGLLGRWKKIASKGLRRVLLVIAFAHVSFAFYLFLHGWIGLRLWAY
ncbi:MAG: serine hydrolase domain-containing protein [Bacteroidota bacterium]